MTTIYRVPCAGTLHTISNFVLRDKYTYSLPFHRQGKCCSEVTQFVQTSGSGQTQIQLPGVADSKAYGPHSLSHIPFEMVP